MNITVEIRTSAKYNFNVKLSIICFNPLIKNYATQLKLDEQEVLGADEATEPAVSVEDVKAIEPVVSTDCWG